MGERLQALSAQSERDETLIVELVYRGRYCQFDVSAMEMKYLPLEEVVRRHFAKGFAAVQVPVGEGQETTPALSSASETNV